MTSRSARLVSVAALVYFSLGVLTAQVPRLPVGEDVKRPANIKHVSPIYPKGARDKKVNDQPVELVMAVDVIFTL